MHASSVHIPRVQELLHAPPLLHARLAHTVGLLELLAMHVCPARISQPQAQLHAILLHVLQGPIKQVQPAVHAPYVLLGSTTPTLEQVRAYSVRIPQVQEPPHVLPLLLVHLAHFLSEALAYHVRLVMLDITA